MTPSLRRKTAALPPYWPGPTREQMARLIGLANWHTDIGEFPDREPQTTIAKPVVLPAEMQKTLNHRIEWNRSAGR